MNEEINAEKVKVIQERADRAKDDLESAEIILKESDNYEISTYHSHQAIEKIIKTALLKKGEKFKFIHDLNILFQQLMGGKADLSIVEKISYVNSLYPMLRYPAGDKITKEQAKKSLAIANQVFELINF